MANKVKQFRYYNNSEVYPSNLTLANLEDGSIFASFFPIKQISIQTLPGTEFYLNASEYPIIVGLTGIFELDFEKTIISDLRFKKTSLENIRDNNSAYLIIDIIYEGGN